MDSTISSSLNGLGRWASCTLIVIRPQAILLIVQLSPLEKYGSMEVIKFLFPCIYQR